MELNGFRSQLANSTQACHVPGERDISSTVTSLLLEELRHPSCEGACAAFLHEKTTIVPAVPLVPVTLHFGAATDYLPGWRQPGR